MDCMMDMDMAMGTLDTRGLIEDYSHGAAGFADDEEQDMRGGFKVEDDDAADWCIRRIKEREAERDRICAIGQKQIEAILAKMDAETEKCANDTNFLTAQLQAYFGKVPHKATKTQETYKLLSGSLVMKRGDFKTTVDDDTLNC